MVVVWPLFWFCCNIGCDWWKFHKSYCYSDSWARRPNDSRPSNIEFHFMFQLSTDCGFFSSLCVPISIHQFYRKSYFWVVLKLRSRLLSCLNSLDMARSRTYYAQYLFCESKEFFSGQSSSVKLYRLLMLVLVIRIHVSIWE
jgi:hypothetical protein